MDLALARDQHGAIITKLMTGPGDCEGAMHRAERQYGLAYWAQFNLRYKKRATASFIERVRQAYLSMLEASVKRDLLKLQVENTRDRGDACIESLISEAENLLVRIQKKESAQ